MTLEEIFSFENLYKSAKKCCNGVRWKTSTQLFENQIMRNVNKIRNQILNGTYRSRGFYKFIINERGVTREIASVHITERMVQKCLCDNYLTPKFSKSFIHDNGACIKGKGTKFAVDRLKTHLHRFWRECKNKGYILLFDISSFFGSIDHATLLTMAKNKIEDPKVFELYKYFVDCFTGDKGLGLGSQISQISAGLYLSPLDHFIKDVLKEKYYGRYMDDGYVISDSREKLQEILLKIKDKLRQEKLIIHPKKTRICALDNFVFLKRHFSLYSNGTIVVKPNKLNISRYIKKAKKLLRKKMFDKNGQLTQTFLAYLREFNYFDKYTKKVVHNV